MKKKKITKTGGWSKYMEEADIVGSTFAWGRSYKQNIQKRGKKKRGLAVGGDEGKKWLGGTAQRKKGNRSTGQKVSTNFVVTN